MTNPSSGEDKTADTYAEAEIPQSTAFFPNSSSPQNSSQLQSDSQMTDPGLRESTTVFQVPLFSTNDFPQKGYDELKPQMSGGITQSFKFPG